MNNYLKVLSLTRDAVQQVVFASDREEGGINLIYDPKSSSEQYQVFIHSILPYEELESHVFSDFVKARSFAAKRFESGWELLKWNFRLDRPCEKEGRECGSGECETCRSLAGEGASACSACGVLDDD